MIYGTSGIFNYDFDWGYANSDVITPKKFYNISHCILYVNCHSLTIYYVDYHYSECYSEFLMLIVITVSVIMLCGDILSVIRISVVILRVFIQNVVSPNFNVQLIANYCSTESGHFAECRYAQSVWPENKIKFSLIFGKSGPKYPNVYIKA